MSLISKVCLSFIVSFCATLPSAQAALVLTPQKVTELALAQGLQTRTAQLQAQRAGFELSQALGVYDLQLAISPGYEYNKAQQLSGQANVVDKTFTLGSTLSKRFATTGTVLSLDYIDTRQRSILSQFAAANRSPNSNLNSLQIGMRQPLWANAFGAADRLLVQSAESVLEISDAIRDESIEQSLIEVMTLFWNAYITDKSFNQNKAAKEKYEQLVRDVRRKKGFALVAPGELPRLEAELKTAEARQLTSYADHINALSALLTALRVPTTEPVVLQVAPTVADLPELAPKDPKSLRSVVIAETNLINASNNLRVVESRLRPQLDFVARARTTGVDPVYESARSEMADARFPTYFVGVEFITPLFSVANRGAITDALLQKQIAENDAFITVDNAKRQLVEIERTARARFDVVKLAADTVDRRERVVTEIERAYRQGREPLVELIRAYNDLFTARIDQASAVGEYYLAIDRVNASRDELIR